MTYDDYCPYTATEAGGGGWIVPRDGTECAIAETLEESAQKCADDMTSGP